MGAYVSGTPVSVSGDGVLSVAYPAVDVVLTAVPAVSGHSATTPPRYRAVGVLGWAVGTARTDPVSLTFADALLLLGPPGADGIYYQLSPGVVATITPKLFLSYSSLGATFLGTGREEDSSGIYSLLG